MLPSVPGPRLVGVRASVRKRKSEDEENWAGLGRERVSTRLTPLLSFLVFNFCYFSLRSS